MLEIFFRIECVPWIVFAENKKEYTLQSPINYAQCGTAQFAQLQIIIALFVCSFCLFECLSPNTQISSVPLSW